MYVSVYTQTHVLVTLHNIYIGAWQSSLKLFSNKQTQINAINIYWHPHYVSGTVLDAVNIAKDET